uniref:Uncharacterized protein n=1 Tax=Knipowitschia caucasica TaxID=637954 RepID=A0AAV2KCC7_KNICA
MSAERLLTGEGTSGQGGGPLSVCGLASRTEELTHPSVQHPTFCTRWDQKGPRVTPLLCWYSQSDASLCWSSQSDRLLSVCTDRVTFLSAAWYRQSDATHCRYHDRVTPLFRWGGSSLLVQSEWTAHTLLYSPE